MCVRGWGAAKERKREDIRAGKRERRKDQVVFNEASLNSPLISNLQ